MTVTRTDATTRYAAERFVREPTRWHDIRALGESLRPGMQMSVYEDALLGWLASLHGAKNVLEIGTFMGLTALWMAQSLPESGQLITLERDAAYAKQARENVAIDKRVNVVEGDALAWLGSQEAQNAAPFDMLFIDGEKKSYNAYLKAALPLLKSGALIVADNTLLFGAMIGEDDGRASPEGKVAMTDFHATLADPARFKSIMLPTNEGLTVAVVI